LSGRFLLYLAMSKRLWCALMLMISINSYAQFSDSVNYYLNFAGTGNINKTNAGTTYLFNNALKFEINKKYVSLNSLTNYTYGQNPTQKTNNDFISIINVDVLRAQQKLYYWGLTSYEKSFSLKVNDRFQAGAGLGYTILKSLNSSLIISDGLLFETSELMQADAQGRMGYQTVRNSLRVKFKFTVRDIFKIDGSDFIQNSLSEKNDYIIKSSTNLSVKLYRTLNLTMAVNYNRLNLTATENLLISYGLMFEKYF
jgi:hypothetical protein